MADSGFPEIPDIAPLSLVLRHAERYSVRDMANPLDALLTEQGKRDALEYGKQLAGLCPVKIYHSPVERCRQTACQLFYGLIEMGGEASLEGPLHELGGPYVKGDFKTIPKLVRRKGRNIFLREWFDGELPEDHLMDFSGAAQLVFGKIAEVSEEAGGASCIFVTHDWNIMLIREYYLHLRHEEVGFPGFLQGVLYYRRNGRGYIRSDGKEVCLSRESG